MSSNLVVHETGSAWVRGCVELETAAGTVAFASLIPRRDDYVEHSPEAGTLLVADPGARFARLFAGCPDARYRVLFSHLPQTLLRRNLGEAAEIDLVIEIRNTLELTEPVIVHGIPVLSLGEGGRLVGRIALGEGAAPLEVRGVPVSLPFPVDPVSGELIAESLAR